MVRIAQEQSYHSVSSSRKRRDDRQNRESVVITFIFGKLFELNEGTICKVVPSGEIRLRLSPLGGDVFHRRDNE